MPLRSLHRRMGCPMLTIGDRFPDFSLDAVVSLEPGDEFVTSTLAELNDRWFVVFAWPMDFTFICPTELAAFGQRHPDFVQRGAALLGVSTDTHYAHLAWRKSHHDLRTLPFPMLADIKRELCASLGILHKEQGVALRATFNVDPSGTNRWVGVHAHAVGRSVTEVLRVLDALQTKKRCPCGWEKGQPTL